MYEGVAEGGGLLLSLDVEDMRRILRDLGLQVVSLGEANIVRRRIGQGKRHQPSSLA